MRQEMEELRLKVTQHLPQCEADDDSEEEKEGGLVLNTHIDPEGNHEKVPEDGLDLLDDDFGKRAPLEGEVDMTIINQAISNMRDEFVVEVLKPIRIVDMNYLS